MVGQLRVCKSDRKREIGLVKYLCVQILKNYDYLGLECYKQCTEPPLPLQILSKQTCNLTTPLSIIPIPLAYAHLPHHCEKTNMLWSS